VRGTSAQSTLYRKPLRFSGIVQKSGVIKAADLDESKDFSLREEQKCYDFDHQYNPPPMIEEVKVGSGINGSKNTSLVNSALFNTDSRVDSGGDYKL
jgi:hypothetical protein